ncbi:competence protein CoiA family protein [Streptomyces sp. NBC_01800]|uniref:competence protein CoiA family protein n=1 Tax=Streptomyces sp. NBC_01800 TaxID=2975945 RepID=UPI002DD9DDEC|nr:competence protein CoiA family protein [Streptomyces sp. NBC_01800]WSA71703.1 competence protein CoiA family protein [Streptomyces sp. NBC_01800]
MYLDEEDTRKVQTAVFGGPDSDTPVFLPMDAVDFDAFVPRYPQRTFYCGSLLGGCGNRLSAKKYKDKKCHFAHVSTVHCRRVASDESSADHLYIGQAVARWLKQQNQKYVQISYKPKRRQVREVVDVRYAAGGRLVRVQMARQSKSLWEADDTALRLNRESVEWLFAPDSMVANWQMDKQGYALRVQCRTQGTSRAVEIGTQFPDRPVEWTKLSECRITSDGIVTPSLIHGAQGIVPRHSVPEPAPAASVVSQPPVTLQLAAETVTFTAAVATDPEIAPPEPLRLLYDAEVHPLGSAVTRARISLPAWAGIPESAHTYMLLDAVLTYGGPSQHAADDWLITAQGMRRVGDPAEPQGTGMHPGHVTPPPADLIAPPTVAKESAGPAALPDDAQIVAVFRETLEAVARSRGVVKTATLAKRAQVPLDTLTLERWRDLLIEVECPRTPGKPFISALIKAPDGGPAPFFRDVLFGLGWTRDFSSAELRAICDRDRRRVHAAFRKETVQPAPSPRTLAPEPVRLNSAGETEKRLDSQLRAAHDALADQAHEAQAAENVEAAEQTAFLLDQLAGSGESTIALDELSVWIVEKRAEELYATWHDLASLLDRLDSEGDDLHPDQLRRLLNQAEILAEHAGDEMVGDDRRHIEQWRDYLTMLNKRPTLREIRSYAAAVRTVLEGCARQARTTTWSELGKRVNRRLASLHPDDRVAVLVEVDRETPERKPLYSVLIAGQGNRPHSLYRQVLFNLDRPVPPAEAVQMHWRMALDDHRAL